MHPFIGVVVERYSFIPIFSAMIGGLAWWSAQLGPGHLEARDPASVLAAQSPQTREELRHHALEYMKLLRANPSAPEDPKYRGYFKYSLADNHSLSAVGIQAPVVGLVLTATSPTGKLGLQIEPVSAEEARQSDSN